MLGKAVFLDKDGTLVENVPYNVDPNKLRLAPGAAEALRALQAEGYLLVVVSNQSGVARGYFDERDLRYVEDRLRSLLRESGVNLDAFYYCPHHPQGVVDDYAVSCACRKPEPGLLLRAAGEHDIDLDRSWFIGDILDDIEAGRRAGCRTILLDNGNETEWLLSGPRLPHYLAADLSAAQAVVCAVDREQGPPARSTLHLLAQRIISRAPRPLDPQRRAPCATATAGGRS